MIEKILPDLYKIEVILPQNPLKALNAYVIKGKERNLMIDTGMNREECIAVLEKSLKELEIDLNQTDFFITHMHADHSGLVSYFQTENSTIFCSKTDADLINEMTYDSRWNELRDFVRSNGFPESELYEAVNNHPGFKYRNKKLTSFSTVKERDVLTIGDYRFQCIETPGHTKGHMCLYEPQKKILLSGDHILHDITPNLTLWSDQDNPLEEYLLSLRKVYELEVQLVLPGHRRLFQDHKKRIEELIRHHQSRTEEILGIIAQKPQDAYTIASQMTWSINCSSFKEFPSQQKMFAISEALAHLQYLEKLGEVRKDIKVKRVIYHKEVS